MAAKPTILRRIALKKIGLSQEQAEQMLKDQMPFLEIQEKAKRDTYIDYRKQIMDVLELPLNGKGMPPKEMADFFRIVQLFEDEGAESVLLDEGDFQFLKKRLEIWEPPASKNRHIFREDVKNAEEVKVDAVSPVKEPGDAAT